MTNSWQASPETRVIERVEFSSEGATLRGLLFRPDNAVRPPIIVMAHGLSATIGMVANEYAEVFCRHGLAVLLYDHRNLGSSDGEPRQEINPWIQARGYLDAIAFARTLHDIDHERIGIWGDSYSAGEVLVVGAIEQRVTAIVSQIPVCGAHPPDVEPTREAFDQIMASLLSGDVSGDSGTTMGPLPVVSSDQHGTPSVLEPIQAFRWFIDSGGQHGTGWVNWMTRVLPSTPVPFSPVLCAPFITASTLIMVAPDDEMTHANYDVARLTFDLMHCPKEWHDIEGGHFGLLYHPSSLFDEASSIQAEIYTRRFSLRESPADQVGRDKDV